MGNRQSQLTREERLRAAQGRPVHDPSERDSREIKRDIERTRGAMDETLDELGERLNPRNLLDDVIGLFRSDSTRDTAQRAGDVAGEFAQNLGRQVRENPIGVTLVGAGLAWLAFGGRRDEDDDYRPIPRRRALQDDYIAGYDDDYDDGPAYYTDEDLLLDPQYGTAESELVMPGSHTENGSPGALDKAKQKASSAASSAGDAASSAWGSTKSTASSAKDSVAGAASSAGEAISDAASSVAGGVKSAAASVGDAVSSAGSATSDASRRAYLRSRAAARDAARGTRRAGRRTGRYASSTTSAGGEQLAQAYDATARRVSRAHDEAPLALGLGVLALGALVGAVIPRTRPEDQWMGEASDDLIDQAKHQAQQVYEQGQEAVENTLETAKQSAESQGLTGDSLAERATRVVEKAAGSISEAAKDEGLHPEQLKEDAKSVAQDTTEQAKAEAQDAKADAEQKAGKVDPDAKKAAEKS